MHSLFSTVKRSVSSPGTASRLLALGTLLLQTGCATTESDLNYSRDQPVQKDGDTSYHGWNEANN